MLSCNHKIQEQHIMMVMILRGDERGREEGRKDRKNEEKAAIGESG